MRRRRRCKSCGGRYWSHQRDGSEYYHACAPIGSDADGQAIERADRRDENVRVDAEGRRVGIGAEGPGAEDV